MSEEIVQITPEPHSISWWLCLGCGGIESTITLGTSEPRPPCEPLEHCPSNAGWKRLGEEDGRVQRILIRHKMIAEKLFGPTSFPPGTLEDPP